MFMLWLVLEQPVIRCIEWSLEVTTEVKAD